MLHADWVIDRLLSAPRSIDSSRVLADKNSRYRSSSSFSAAVVVLQEGLAYPVPVECSQVLVVGAVVAVMQ